MTFGALVFIMCLLLNYFYHCIEYINESTSKIQLEGLAYNDALTGISNRSKCEQFLAELSGTYTIISLDLDHLKYTNDNYGHAQGDKLISGFSDILQNSFTDASLIGRMGGDEFIVVLPFIDEERTKRDLDGFVDLMNIKNSSGSKLRFSASWGYASSKEKELKSNPSAQKVYLLADQRMYVMKNQHHKQSLGRLYNDLMDKLLDKGGAADE
jgi:diguanylate cyclase (GGDEF)-like protein